MTDDTTQPGSTAEVSAVDPGSTAKLPHSFADEWADQMK
jgi:hypothetical protein